MNPVGHSRLNNPRLNRAKTRPPPMVALRPDCQQHTDGAGINELHPTAAAAGRFRDPDAGKQQKEQKEVNRPMHR